MSKWTNEISNIKALGIKGTTISDIAQYYAVSKQRMQQIVAKYIPDWYENYGLAVSRKEYAKKYFDKWGNKDTTDLYSVQRLKFRNKKSNAVRTGYEWTVTFGELEWPENCPILGIPINYFAEYREEGSCSFDRVDNTKGYVPGNVKIISWRANRIKNDGTAEEHRKIADFLDSL